MALEHAFHGRTALTLALTCEPGRKRGMATYTAFPFITHVQAPYCYRCHFTYPQCEVKCFEAVEEAIKFRSPGDMAIFIAEPILAVGGVIVPPQEYWNKVANVCHENGITLIFDEVFCGFGRTGRMFASEHWGVIPEIMTMAKAIGGGFPLAAFIAKEEVANSFEPGDHYTTFGLNNLISTTAGLANLRVMEEEKLIDNAANVGKLFLEGLREIQEKCESIGEVRGKGLMIGVEMVEDKKSRAPAPNIAKAVARRFKENGVLVQPGGAHNNVLRFTPPLVITKSQVNDVLRAAGKSFLAGGK